MFLFENLSTKSPLKPFVALSLVIFNSYTLCFALNEFDQRTQDFIALEAAWRELEPLVRNPGPWKGSKSYNPLGPGVDEDEARRELAHWREQNRIYGERFSPRGDAMDSRAVVILAAIKAFKSGAISERQFSSVLNDSPTWKTARQNAESKSQAYGAGILSWLNHYYHRHVAHIRPWYYKEVQPPGQLFFDLRGRQIFDNSLSVTKMLAEFSLENNWIWESEFREMAHRNWKIDEGSLASRSRNPSKPAQNAIQISCNKLFKNI